MRFLIGIAPVLLMMFTCSQISSAQIPRMLSYQGVLTDSLGSPKPDGTYSLTFRLYDVESDGTALWTEAKTLSVERGLFSTNLGDQVVFGPGVRFDRQYWLSVQVGSGVELSPRIPLSAVGYSLNSQNADTAQYARKAATPSLVDSARMSITVPDASITTAKIQNGTIQFVDIGQNGAASGQVMKWGSGGWAPAPDATGGGSGGWTDDGTVIGLSTPSDTVRLGSASLLGKLNVGGDIGLSLPSNVYFGSSATRISGMIGGDMRLVAEDLSMLTTEDITFGHFGDETWIKFNNATKRAGIGTMDPVDRLHVINDIATSCWLRIESAHTTNWGQAGLRIKTPQNMWNLRMDTYANNNIPNGGLSLYSQNSGAEAMTWLMDGKVGIGTITPSRKLHVNGSAQIRDTLYANVVNAGKILNGPGVVHQKTAPRMPIRDSWTLFDSVTVQAPGSGYVLLLFSSTLWSSHTFGDVTYAYWGISTTPDDAGLLTDTQWFLWKACPSGSYYIPAAVQAVASIASSGSKKFYAVGIRYNVGETPDHIEMQSNSLTALFVPASYGSVETTASVAMPSLDASRLKEHAVVQGSSVEMRLEALTQELQALRNELHARVK